MPTRFTTGLRHFLTDEEGVSAVEYAVLLAALLAIVHSAVVLLGSKNNAVWTGAADHINRITPP